MSPKISDFVKRLSLFVSLLTLIACDGDKEDKVPSQLRPFNITSFSASTSGPKKLSISWSSASDGPNITYSVCKKDTDLPDVCEKLLTQTNNLDSIVSIASLRDSLSSYYFVLAEDSNGNSIASNEVSLDANLVTSMIGYFKASNTENDDKFGYSISANGSGSIIAVSAPGEDSDARGVHRNSSGVDSSNLAPDSGAVYIFGIEDNIWKQTAYIKASNTNQYDAFGQSLALSKDGNFLAIGAPYEDSDTRGIISNGSELNNSRTAYASGAVYLYENQNGNWKQVAFIKSSNSKWGDEFGHKVALDNDGNTLVVSAVGEDTNAKGIITDGSEVTNTTTKLNSGAIYVFSRENDFWLQTSYIKASNTDRDDLFGFSLGLSDDGDVLVVGSRGEDNAATGVWNDNVTSNSGTALNSGAAYIFSRIDGLWAQAAYIKASNSESGDYFASDIALSGNGKLVAISSTGEDNGASHILSDGSELLDTGLQPDSGAVYLFSEGPNGWQQTHYIKSPNPQASDYFGRSLAMSENGNVLAVGATGEDSDITGIQNSPTDYSHGIKSNSGATHIFSLDSGAWIHDSYIKASNTGVGDIFGHSVSLNAGGDMLIVSSPNEDSNVTGIITDSSDQSRLDESSNAGAVYLF